MVSGPDTLLATCFCYSFTMQDQQAKLNRSFVLRMLGVGGGAGFALVVLVVILVIIWTVDP